MINPLEVMMIVLPQSMLADKQFDSLMGKFNRLKNVPLLNPSATLNCNYTHFVNAYLYYV